MLLQQKDPTPNISEVEDRVDNGCHSRRGAWSTIRPINSTGEYTTDGDSVSGSSVVGIVGGSSSISNKLFPPFLRDPGPGIK